MKIQFFRGYLLFVLVAIVLLLSFCNQEVKYGGGKKKMKFKWIAHRGGVVNDTIPENSTKAMKEAIKRGYTMVETDVRFTKDSIPVVHHDKDFLKQFGDSSLVRDVEAKGLKNIVHPVFGNHPLTLKEFAALTEGKIGLLIDVKGKDYPDFYYREIADILKEYKIYTKSRVAWSKESRAYFSNNKDIKINLNSSEFNQLYDTQKDSIDPTIHFFIEDATKLDSLTIYKAQKAGLEVTATINQWHYRHEADHFKAAKADAGRMKKLGVTNFQFDAIYEPYFIN